VIDIYLNQAAVWKQKTGTDGYGKATFEADQNIWVRLEYKSKLIRNTQGDLVVVQGTISTNKAIDAEDVVVMQGYLPFNIQGVSSEVPDLDGDVTFREVYF
jgi:hypothetical protein